MMCFLQRTRHYENKLDELRQELTRVKLEAGEARASHECAQEKETALKTRLEKATSECDVLRTEAQKLRVRMCIA